MLSKKLRLLRQDFLSVKKSGSRISSQYFSAVVYKHPQKQIPSRFSVVVSQKIAKKAVIRNSVRRRIYDSLKKINTGIGLDIIIFPKPSMLNLNDEKVTSEIDSFISKISA